MKLKRPFTRIYRYLNPTSDPRISLLRQMPKGAICAEVGVWKGDFSQKILRITNPTRLYLIDPYQYFETYEKAWFGGVSGSQGVMDEICEGVKTRFAKQITSHQVEIIRQSSIEGLNSLDEHALDWAYIDGNHMYEYVIKDLELAWKKIRPGGFLTGDDYKLEGWWDDGVTKAVDEFAAHHDSQIVKSLFIGTQFILQKSPGLS